MQAQSPLNHDSPGLSITKCDHAGIPQVSYPGRIIYADEHVIAARCIWYLQRTYRLGSFSITEGDILIEFYYTQHWFNIFAIYTPFGRQKGWYCNIAYPVKLQEQHLLWHDLALDLLILPNEQRHVLDLDEFEALPLSARDRVQARAEFKTLQQWADRRRGPFAEILRKKENDHGN